jgi:hypothetical protein
MSSPSEIELAAGFTAGPLDTGQPYSEILPVIVDNSVGAGIEGNIPVPALARKFRLPSPGDEITKRGLSAQLLHVAPSAHVRFLPNNHRRAIGCGLTLQLLEALG